MKIMNLEKPFDPRDPEYKSVSDLPAEERNHFHDVNGGGFVTQGAFLNSAEYAGNYGKLKHGLPEEAEMENRQREDYARWMPVIERLSGGRVTKEDIGRNVNEFHYAESHEPNTFIVNNIHPDYTYKQTINDHLRHIVTHEYVMGSKLGEHPHKGLEVTGKKLQALRDHQIDVNQDGSTVAVDGVSDKYFKGLAKVKEGEEITIDLVEEPNPRSSGYIESFLLKGSVDVVDCSERIQEPGRGFNQIGRQLRARLSKGSVIVQVYGSNPGTAYHEEARYYKICE